MSALPQRKPEPPTLAALAREALKAANGVTAEAKAALCARLRQDEKLLSAVLEGVIADAASYRVEASMRNDRERIVAANTGGGRASVVALAAGISNALLDMPLAGGIRLRFAGREAVFRQADLYASQASDMSRKARWLRAIGALINDDRTVGEVVSEQRAAKLWKEAAR